MLQQPAAPGLQAVKIVTRCRIAKPLLRAASRASTSQVMPLHISKLLLGHGRRNVNPPPPPELLIAI